MTCVFHCVGTYRRISRLRCMCLQLHQSTPATTSRSHDPIPHINTFWSVNSSHSTSHDLNATTHYPTSLSILALLCLGRPTPTARSAYLFFYLHHYVIVGQLQPKAHTTSFLARPPIASLGIRTSFVCLCCSLKYLCMILSRMLLVVV